MQFAIAQWKRNEDNCQVDRTLRIFWVAEGCVAFKVYFLCCGKQPNLPWLISESNKNIVMKNKIWTQHNAKYYLSIYGYKLH